MTEPESVTQDVPDLIAVGAQEIKDRGQALGLTWNLRLATVHSNVPLTITYDGDTVPIGATALTAVPGAGERVYGMIIPPAGNFVFSAHQDYFNATGSLTTTSTTYAAGTGTVCGVAFAAPLSGQVSFIWSAEVSNSGANLTLASIQVSTGATLDSGTVILAADDLDTIRNGLTTVLRITGVRLLTGLIPYAAYNVVMKYRVAAGTGTYDRRRILVMPA